MNWIKWVLAYLFDCVHTKTTWPQRGQTGLDYVCCLDCGRELAYSIQLMSIISKDEQLQEVSTVGSSSKMSDPHTWGGLMQS
jgi:hypothetical protein